jgi:WD40 repeat protein
MTYARTAHTTSILKNGKVLVAGGYCDNDNIAELYDPSTGNWTITDNLRYGRWDHTASVLKDGRVLVVGGGGNTAEIYDPSTGN